MLIFAGKSLPGAGSDAASPTSRFFQRVPIGPFSEDESREAIRKPVQFMPEFAFEEDAARLIHERAAGHPYFIKAICHQVFELLKGQGEVDTKRLMRVWPKVEEGLGSVRFVGEFENRTDGEKDVLLRASLLGEQFAASDLRGLGVRSVDTHLHRLVNKRIWTPLVKLRERERGGRVPTAVVSPASHWG